MSRVLVRLLPVLLVACASAPPPRPAALDPANPAAPEAAPAVVSPLVASPAPAEPVEPAPAHEHGDAAELFTCPMHPEVTASAPGRCPKCGMKLVARPPGSKK
jgi:hypothetical protein